MSSEIVRIVELHCDGEGCDAVYKAAQDNSILARATAQACDWLCLRGNDYCPECAERPKIVKDFADGLHGTPEHKHDMLVMFWPYLHTNCRERFIGEDDFVRAVEAELAERAMVSREL